MNSPAAAREPCRGWQKGGSSTQQDQELRCGGRVGQQCGGLAPTPPWCDASVGAAEQSRAGQSRAQQSRTRQSRTGQSRAEHPSRAPALLLSHPVLLRKTVLHGFIFM